MAGHRNINVLREKMGPERVARAKARAKEIQAEMLRKLERVAQADYPHRAHTPES
jgi:hypothetical protein